MFFALFKALFLRLFSVTLGDFKVKTPNFEEKSVNNNNKKNRLSRNAMLCVVIVIITVDLFFIRVTLLKVFGRFSLLERLHALTAHN